MTREETINGNILIAKFMDFEVYYKNGIVPTIRFLFEQDTPVSEYCKYDCSWDFLMPVVEKIEATYLMSIRGCSCSIDEWEKENNVNEINKRGFYTADTKIGATWIAVTEFIKLYNERKKP
jgi:hypothetical protein